jgi:antirestriction protein
MNMIKSFNDFILESKTSLLKENSHAKTPAVYCGTYGKYANGSIEGEWVNITDFDTYEEFMDYCHKLHGDEEESELMFQDFEGFPKSWYSESGMSEETFDRIKEYAELDDDKREAYELYLDNYNDKGSLEDFEERYKGHFNSPEEFASDFYHQLYDIPEYLEDFIDWSAVWRSLYTGNGYNEYDGHIFYEGN